MARGVRTDALLALLLISTAAPAGGTRSPFGIEAYADYAAARGRQGEEIAVSVVFDIAERHKIYAETVEIRVAPGETVKLLRVDRPVPVEKYDRATDETRQVYLGRAVFKLALEAPEADRPDNEVEVRLAVRFQGCSETVCFLPEQRDLTLRIPPRREGERRGPVNRESFARVRASGGALRQAQDAAVVSLSNGGGALARQAAAEPPGARGDDFAQRGPVVAILVAFVFGLLLSFTPCVYPLVPVTVAVIGARSAAGGWRKGFLLSLAYVLGLSVTYALLGVLAAKGGSTVGAAGRHPAVVGAVALLFVALAASLFGVFDIEMPSSWQARLRMRRAGGPVGVFLTGLLSGFVATPCVAAPLASVLVFIATTGSVVLGAAMLFAMAWGMGVLLILAGTFSGALAGLPKAGGWMLAVKTGLGVILLLAALYFARPVLPLWMSTAWLAAPLVGFGLWRGIIARTPPDASRGKLALRAAGISALVFGLYFGVGALVRAGMPAPVISAFYPDDVVPARSKIAFRSVKRRADYEAALAEARESGRPVMIDFVLPNCSGCRELADGVFSRDDVAAEAGRFVALHVDLSEPPVPVERLKAEYRIFGAPSVVWIESSGAIRHDLTVADGGTPPAEFLRRMREVK